MLPMRKPLEEKRVNHELSAFDVLVNKSLNQDQQKSVTFESNILRSSSEKLSNQKAVEQNATNLQNENYLEKQKIQVRPLNGHPNSISGKGKSKNKSPTKTDNSMRATHKHQLKFLTPKRQKMPKTSNTISSSIKKRSGKLIRRLTPPRHLDVGCRTPKRRSIPGDKSSLPLTLSPRYSNAKSFELRSCELDPSSFQMEIQSHESCLANCLICSVMDSYVEKGGVNFDFSSLMQWAKPNGMTRNASSELESSDKQNTVLIDLKKVADDISVEGFFREYYPDSSKEGGLGRVEVSIFSSNQLGRFIVCYRGSSDVQDRPIQGKGVSGQSKENKKHTSNTKSKEDDECQGVNHVISSAYNAVGLKHNVFTLLNRLTALKPFTDITMTGHSFGACLATLAAKEYASNRPRVRVACQVFGSPHVGGRDFRNDVHSLPNLNVSSYLFLMHVLFCRLVQKISNLTFNALKVIRIERSTDPFVSLPESSSGWTHVGHSIRLTPSMTSFGISEESKQVGIQLYRFDKHRPPPSFVKSSVTTLSNLTKLKIGNEIKSYLKDLERISSQGLPWASTFVGASGKGIVGTDKEERCVV